MDNIVSTWEEIELTDAELQIIYGACGCDGAHRCDNDLLPGVAALFFGASGTGTFAVNGTFTHSSTDMFGGTISKMQL